MVSTVKPKASATPCNPIPTLGNAADRTALPQPPKTSQKVPMNSAARRRGISISPFIGGGTARRAPGSAHPAPFDERAKPGRSVLPEDALQLLAVAGRRQRYGRKNARFLWVEVVSDDPIVFVVGLFCVANHEPAAGHAGRPDDLYALLAQLDQRGHDAVGYRTVAGAGVDERLCTFLRKGFIGHVGHVAVAIDNFDRCQRIDAIDVEFGLYGVPLRG